MCANAPEFIQTCKEIQCPQTDGACTPGMLCQYLCSYGCVLLYMISALLVPDMCLLSLSYVFSFALRSAGEWSAFGR